MQAHGLTNLASADFDFDRERGIKRYAPAYRRSDRIPTPGHATVSVSVSGSLKMPVLSWAWAKSLVMAAVEGV